MSETIEYAVPGMSCAHCTTAVTQAAEVVPGVSSVEVNLDTKVVVVHGENLDDAAIREAIDEAGYEAA